MKQQTSPAIILRRTNYAEADRIITFLTPAGKIRAIVKGVRRSKSKLAGGIELFSENTITFLETRGDLARVISTRLEHHWSGIVGDLQRMMFGYEVMKYIDRVVEAEAERDYFELLKQTLTALEDQDIPLSGVQTWFYMRFLELLGYGLNLKTSSNGAKLAADNLYTFSNETMSFEPNPSGSFRPEHIKFLRLSVDHTPGFMRQVKEANGLANELVPILSTCVKQQSGV